MEVWGLNFYTSKIKVRLLEFSSVICNR